METKVTLKFRDEDRNFDLEKPEDFAKIKELAEKGWAFERGQTQLKEVSKERDELKEQIDVAQGKLASWNAVLGEAQKGDLSQLHEALSRMEIKIPETKKDDDEFLKDEGDKVLNTIQSKIDDLNKTMNQRLDTVEGAVYNQFIGSEHATLEAKYNGKDGWPAYDRKTVQDYSLKHGIQDMEKAYRELNFDKIMEAQTQKAGEHQGKINKAKSDDPGGGGEPLKPPKVYDKSSGGYEAANEEWFKEMKQEGKSLREENG